MAADDDVTDGAPADPKDKKKAANRQRMMIGVGAVGLLLTYLLLRRSQSASTTSSSGGTDADAQALAQYEQQTQANLAGLASSLQALQAQVASDVPVGPTSTGTTSPAQTTPTTTPSTNKPAPTAPATTYTATGTLQSVLADLANGQTLYQSGAEADAWDLEYGIPKGQSLPAANDYYALSPAAAQNLAKSGKPVYVKS